MAASNPLAEEFPVLAPHHSHPGLFKNLPWWTPPHTNQIRISGAGLSKVDSGVQPGAEKQCPNPQGFPTESALTKGQEWPFLPRPAAPSVVCGPADTATGSLLQTQVLQPHPTDGVRVCP